MALTITIASTDRTKYVETATLSIVDQINDQPNTANFSCFGFTPAIGNAVTIADGSETAFAGYIQSVSRLYRRPGDRTTYRVAAIDASYNADNSLATGAWSSLTTAFGNIFSGIEGSADPSIVIFTAALEDVIATAQRIANQYGGWWDIDRTSTTLAATLYANGAYAGTGPSVSTSTTHWWDLDWTTDARQVRDKVYASAYTIQIPVAVFVGGSQWLVPVSPSDYAKLLGFPGYESAYMWGRDAIDIGQYASSPMASTVTTSPAAIGATSIAISAVPSATNGVFALINGQYVYCAGSNSTTQLSGIPSSGLGSITAAIPSGSVVTFPDIATAGNLMWSPTEPTTATIYTSYGSGTHLRMIGGGYPTTAEALSAATNEHTKWSSPETRGSYSTTDATAYAGNSTAITTGGLNATYLINRSTITWDEGRNKFVKKVEFATQRRDLVNILLSR